MSIPAIDSVLHGFRLFARERIDEVNSEVLSWRHEKTGTELVVLLCDDDNKVFMVGFPTVPSDDTGVAHILEHSVLNGSKKFPVKEPFAELRKGSLFTFLNAMTYPDRTIYPVASRNATDFSNLMDVYLDAVFNPILSRNTFLQEGWHYELEQADAEMTYSGVVYNEMLGSYSDPETLLSLEIDRCLYSDSIYGLSSGGDPEHIPELTYEEFCDFHDRNYHPSNGRIVLYGDIDLDDRLAHVARYLDAYAMGEISVRVERQPRHHEPLSCKALYPFSGDGPVTGRTYAARCYMLEPPTDPVFLMAMSILAQILIGTSASPLRKALVDSHLGEDVLSWGFEHEILDSHFIVGLKGTEPERVEDMEKIIDETLARLVADGIDDKTVEAAFNTTEFALREANFGGYSKGLVYGLSMMNNWFYNADPLAHLRYEPTLEAVRVGIEGGRYFEDLIDRHFLKNPHRVTITLAPDADMEAERIALLEERLKGKRDDMSPDTRAAVIDDCSQLHAAQLVPDSAEALATIPSLALSEINRNAELYPFEMQETNGVAFSFSPQPTNGIGYLNVSFDTAAVPRELLEYLPIFGSAMMQAGTSKRDYVEMTQEIGINTGGINPGLSVSGISGAPDGVKCRVSFRCKALTGRLRTMCDLLSEILADCDLDNSDRIRELIQIGKSKIQGRIIPAGHTFVSKRLAAVHSRSGQYAEVTGGLSQYMFLEELAGRVETDPGSVTEPLKQLREALFNRNFMHVHITGGDPELEEIGACLGTLMDGVASGPAPTPAVHEFEPVPTGEGWIIPSKIQYVGMGASLYDMGYTYSGTFEVLDNYLNSDYLWNTVRVQGGAYGCFSGFDRLTGNFHCVSYRDPRLAETLTVYSGIADALAGLELDDAEFDKLIIGTIGSIDTPLAPDQKGAVALNRFFTNISAAEVQQHREELLGSRKGDLRAYADLFRRFADEATVCVLGSEEKLRADAARFSVVAPVF